MIDEAKQEQAAMYVLGLLSGNEEAQFRAALGADEELRQLVDELEASAAAMVHALPVEKAPPELFAKVMASARGEAPAPSAPRRSIAAWMLAACAAIAAFVFYSQSTGAKSALEQLRAQYEAVVMEKDGISAKERAKALRVEELVKEEAGLVAARDRMQAERDRLVAERAAMEKQLGDFQKREVLAELKIATLKSQVEAYAQVVAVAVWNVETQTGIVKLDGLPPVPTDKDYQLWVIDPKYPAPVSAGVMKVGKDGATRAIFKPAKPIGAADKFAVSIERKGGAPSAQGQIVLLSN